MKIKVCSTCKSEDVESLYWVNINTKEVGQRKYPDNKSKNVNYCGGCMEYVTIEDKE